MAAESMRESTNEYAEYVTDDHKAALSRLTAPLVEIGFSSSHYTETLVRVDRQLRKVAARIGAETPPVWVEQGGKTLLVGHLDHLRRDVRHALLTKLVDADVVAPVEHSVQRGVSRYYIPFKFGGCTRGPAKSSLRALHAAMRELYPLVEAYIPDVATLTKALEDKFRSKTGEFRGWTLHRVEVGHPPPVRGYHTLKSLSKDVLYVKNDKDGSLAVLTAPAHPLLSRETYVSGRDGPVRLFSCMTLYLNFYASRPDGTRVHMAFDYSPLVVSLELPGSERFEAFAKCKPRAMTIQPMGKVVHTLCPEMWFRYEMALGHPHIAAAWLAIGCMTSEGPIEQRLRTLDRLAAGIFEGVDARLCDMARVCATESVPGDVLGKTAVPLAALRKLAVPLSSDEVFQEGRRSSRGKEATIVASAPVSPTKWAIRVGDAVYAPTGMAMQHDFRRVLRMMADACIASYMLDQHPSHHVTYITTDSMQDTFY